MPSESMNDMVPPEGDRSIRKIQVNKGEKSEEKDTPPEPSSEGDDKDNMNETKNEKERKIYNQEPSKAGSDPYLRNTRNKSYKAWIWAVGAILLVFVFLSLTPLFTSANLSVIPKSQEVQITGDFTALPEGESGEAEVNYSTLIVESVGEEKVQATGEEEVERKASGRITIFNEFSEESERLIANTRFETEDGLIYRIESAVVVPGMRELNGQEIPGQLEVTVFADEAGEEYNISNAEFTIPGLEGDPRFETMYAKTKGPITGGFVGITKTASDEDVENARQNIRDSQENKVEEEIASALPEGFYYFPGTAEITFESLPPESSSDSDEVVVKERLIIETPIFNQSLFASFVASETIGTYDGHPVRLNSIEGVSFEVQDDEEDSEAILFDLEGSTTVIWDVDYEELLKDILGESKDEVEVTLSTYEGIQKADLSIRPFWRRSVPDEADKVTVEEDLNVD